MQFHTSLTYKTMSENPKCAICNVLKQNPSAAEVQCGAVLALHCT